MPRAKTQTPTQPELLAQFTRDIRLAAADTGMTSVPPTSPGSDWYLLATACSNLAMVGVMNTQVSDEATDVRYASGQDLKDIRDAEGLPPVVPKGSSGRVVPSILGPTTIRAGQRGVFPNGKQFQVVGNYPSPSAGSEIDVIAIDVGTATNLAAGETVRFTPAPTNVEIEATVSRSAPLTGGVDEETDERMRQRIYNVRRNRPAGGNWAYIRKLVTDELPGVQDCHIYPALGGPSSCKVVPVRDFDLENLDFSRACSSALLQQVRQLIWSKVPIGEKIVVGASIDQLVDFTLRISIPDSALSGGNGQGWTDAIPWPQLVPADSDMVVVSGASASFDSIVVAANTTVSPVAGQTTIAWWCIGDRKFYTALVVSVSGVSGAWVLQLDRPLVSSTGTGVVSGDFICPAAQNLNGYAKTWIDYFRSLGPGENTEDLGRLPRAKRHPYVTDEDPSEITNVVYGAFKNNHREITNIEFGSAPTTAPDVPVNCDTSPSILVPERFAVYPR